jgi:predicted RNase H-like nuclease (RuvC/YqgF family)
MQAAQMAAMEHMTGDVWRVGCDIERELNAANIEIERLTQKVSKLREGAEEQKQRIKRLEKACGEMVSEEDTYIRLQTWLKAKEDKP